MYVGSCTREYLATSPFAPIEVCDFATVYRGQWLNDQVFLIIVLTLTIAMAINIFFRLLTIVYILSTMRNVLKN